MGLVSGDQKAQRHLKANGFFFAPKKGNVVTTGMNPKPPVRRGSLPMDEIRES